MERRDQPSPGCLSLREALDQPPQVAAGRLPEELVSHLEECADCRRHRDVSTAIDLALDAALPGIEVPEGMWARFEVRLDQEPVPEPDRAGSVLGWLRGLLPGAGTRSAMAGACLFLIAYRAMWWDVGSGFVPMTEQNLHWAGAEDGFSRTMSSIHEEETQAILESVIEDRDYRWGLMQEEFDAYGQHLQGGPRDPG